MNQTRPQAVFSAKLRGGGVPPSIDLADHLKFKFLTVIPSWYLGSFAVQSAYLPTLAKCLGLWWGVHSPTWSGVCRVAEQQQDLPTGAFIVRDRHLEPLTQFVQRQIGDDFYRFDSFSLTQNRIRQHNLINWLRLA